MAERVFHWCLNMIFLNTSKRLLPIYFAPWFQSKVFVNFFGHKHSNMLVFFPKPSFHSFAVVFQLCCLAILSLILKLCLIFYSKELKSLLQRENKGEAQVDHFQGIGAWYNSHCQEIKMHSRAPEDFSLYWYRNLDIFQQW